MPVVLPKWMLFYWIYYCDCRVGYDFEFECHHPGWCDRRECLTNCPSWGEWGPCDQGYRRRARNCECVINDADSVSMQKQDGNLCTQAKLCPTTTTTTSTTLAPSTLHQTITKPVVTSTARQLETTQPSSAAPTIHCKKDAVITDGFVACGLIIGLLLALLVIVLVRLKRLEKKAKVQRKFSHRTMRTCCNQISRTLSFAMRISELMLWLLLLLLRRAPRALESGPSERQHLLGVGREDSECGRRTTKGVLPEAIEVGASLQPVLECLRLLLAQRTRRVGCRIQ